jgi:tetratricopeptide (TPR) repeat protein
MLAACSSETLERQKEQIREQELEISRQRKELETLAARQQIEDQKKKECSRAFRDYFDKAQSTTKRDDAISLYQQGLTICPDDDVAHYELGRALVEAGRNTEAAQAFESALQINPDFAEARRQLDAIQKNR